MQRATTCHRCDGPVVLPWTRGFRECNHCMCETCNKESFILAEVAHPSFANMAMLHCSCGSGKALVDRRIVQPDYVWQ